jgi:type IX secretion system PorP/SprF family membrane protein
MGTFNLLQRQRLSSFSSFNQLSGIRKIFLILCLFIFCLPAAAQEVIPTYSDYLTDNLFLLHPSMAGAANRNQIRLTARQQWFDVEDAPSLQTLSINGRVGEKVGLGAILFNDSNGNFSKSGAYAAFAYHLMFSRSNAALNQLSFGISGGLIQHRLDQSGFTEFDPALGGNDSDIYANMDFGISYYYMNFYSHFAAKNILSVSRELFYSDAVPSNQRKYLASAGYIFEDISNSFSLEPSVLFQLREATNEKAVDANLKVYRDVDFGQVWGGLSYRNTFEGAEYTGGGEELQSQLLSYITPFVGVNYRDFLVGYTFTYQLNSLVLSNNGFHQITLGYNFGKSRKRYDCKCPAVNY